MFDKKIIIVTPWFERFAGGAELLARGMARELNQRGITTTVFTTCSLSPYDSWWEDHYRPGVYDVAGIETRRFATIKDRAPYDAVIRKLRRGANLNPRDEQDFFDFGINSSDLVEALAEYIDGDYEIIALPYFHGLTNSVINRYPGKISLIPCFHNEPQFYWATTERLLGSVIRCLARADAERPEAARRRLQDARGQVLSRRPQRQQRLLLVDPRLLPERPGPRASARTGRRPGRADHDSRIAKRAPIRRTALSGHRLDGWLHSRQQLGHGRHLAHDARIDAHRDSPLGSFER